MEGFCSPFGGQRFAHHGWMCRPLRELARPREEDHAKGGETEPVQQHASQANEGSTLVKEDKADDAKNIAHEEAEAEPAWKDARPHGHGAKEQRADDRQWPDDIQEVRRRERGHQTADTALQDREDQGVEPDDDQPNEANPPYLCGLSSIQSRQAQQEEDATQEVDERGGYRRNGQVEVCHGHEESTEQEEPTAETEHEC